MGETRRTTDEIRAEIERVRETLVQDVNALEETVRDKLDWKRPVRERPLVYLGGALALGIVLGLL
jgi:hypothetical protein